MNYFRKITNKCLVCEKDFQFKPSQLKVKGGGRYCSKRCFYNRTKVAKICLACGKAFAVPPVRKDSAKYCSQSCQYSNQMIHKRIYFNCIECGKNFYSSPSHIKRNKKVFCSLSCNGKYYGLRREIKGKSNPNWKGGITPVNKIIRTSSKYKQWRTSVFKRDNYTCILCGQVGGHLEADHIKEFSKYPELRFELSNGRTLCYECHKKTPNYAYKAVV